MRLETIAGIGAALRDGRKTATTLLNDCLAAIAARNDDLNAFILVRAEAALAEARGADAALADGEDRSPLQGIPIALKDLIDLEGVPTTAASRPLLANVARADAPIVTRLREADAVIVGKCNLHELAFGTTGEESAFGAMRNPLDRTRSAGGSSGGSAIAVATGMAVASIGSDTGGSIRIPASACGVVGLKPTHGEVSVDGMVPLAPSLDHVGPIARTVEDAALVYRIIRDAGTNDDIPEAPAATRLGVPRRYFLDLIDPAVEAAFDRAVAWSASRANPPRPRSCGRIWRSWPTFPGRRRPRSNSTSRTPRRRRRCTPARSAWKRSGVTPSCSRDMLVRCRLVCGSGSRPAGASQATTTHARRSGAEC